MNLDQSPEWGTRRTRRFLPSRNRICHISPTKPDSSPPFSLSDHPSSPLPAATDIDALGEDDASIPSLPLPKFQRWATSARKSLIFVGSGGMEKLDRDEVFRVSRVSSDVSNWNRAPRIAYVARSSGGFQVPRSLTCGCAFFPSLADPRYVLWMNQFLVGSSVPITSLSTWDVNLRIYKNSTTGVPPTKMFQLKSWHALSMITRRFIFPDDWDLLRTDRSARHELGYCCRELPVSSLLVDVYSFSQLPSCVNSAPLPAGIALNFPPILRYFSNVGWAQSALSPNIGSLFSAQYESAFNQEVYLMIVVILYTDWHWTRRCSWIDTESVEAMHLHII